jgi:hypothetical protein
MSHNPKKANAFIAAIAVIGICSVANGFNRSANWHLQEALPLLAIAVAASRMKVTLPGLTGTMSVNLPFVLIAVAGLNLAEALLVGCASTAAQCWPSRGAMLKPAQLLFNVSSMASAVAVGWQVFHHGANGQPAWLAAGLLLPLAGLGFFLIQTVSVSIVIALTDGGLVRKIWSTIVQMTFPYFVLSAGVASMAMAARQAWPVFLLVLLVMYGTYRSFRVYFRREVAAKAATAAN